MAAAWRRVASSRRRGVASGLAWRGVGAAGRRRVSWSQRSVWRRRVASRGRRVVERRWS
ncbi:hypothetical protein ACXZ9C_10495 [Streptococcus agalactiae]